MPLKDLLFGFEGRIRRRTWWLWSIAASLAYVLVAWAGTLLFSPGGTIAQPVIGDPLAPLLLNVAITVPHTWLQLALAAKRAHDRNKAAWVVMALQAGSVASSYLPVDPFVPGALSIENGALVAVMTGFVLLMLIASLYLLVVLGFLDGTPGPNRFGRSPKGIGGDTADKAAEVFS